MDTDRGIRCETPDADTPGRPEISWTGPAPAPLTVRTSVCALNRTPASRHGQVPPGLRHRQVEILLRDEAAALLGGELRRLPAHLRRDRQEIALFLLPVVAPVRLLERGTDLVGELAAKGFNRRQVDPDAFRALAQGEQRRAHDIVYVFHRSGAYAGA